MTDFFGPGSPYLSHPLLTAERTQREVDRILEHCATHVGESPSIDVLDLGCGFGRHSLELSRRGSAVVAVDPSPTMLKAAQEKATAEGLDIEFVLATSQDFRRNDAFDLIVSLFTSFGQVAFGTVDDRSERVLENVSHSLRPGATFVVELPERSRALAGLVAEETLGSTVVTRRYDETTAQMRETFQTPSQTFDLAYRLYDREELCDLLEGFDLAIVDVVDDALVTPPSTFMTIVAERAR